MIWEIFGLIDKCCRVFTSCNDSIFKPYQISSGNYILQTFSKIHFFLHLAVDNRNWNTKILTLKILREKYKLVFKLRRNLNKLLN